jgi:hypothetical protein
MTTERREHDEVTFSLGERTLIILGAGLFLGLLNLIACYLSHYGDPHPFLWWEYPAYLGAGVFTSLGMSFVHNWRRR